MHTYFKLGERNEKTLIKGSFAEFDESTFVVGTSTRMVPLVLFEVGCLDKAGRDGVDVDELLEDNPTLVEIALSLLEL